MGVYNNQNARLNTFQIVITSDGAQSYIQFNYGWRAQQWARGSASTTAFPQVGFDAGDGVNYFNALGSQTSQMLNLFLLSNAQPNNPGKQCFKIDSTTIASPSVMSPDANLTNLVPNGGLSLSPLYSRTVNSYSLRVTNGFALTLTPTAVNQFQTITIQGAVVGSGTASAAVVITSAATWTIVVTAADGITQRVMTVAISIIPSADPRLSALAVQGYTFTEGAFDSTGNTLRYTLTLPSSVTSITFTGTAMVSTSTVRMASYGPFGGTFSIPSIATVVGTTRFVFNSTAENLINWRVRLMNCFSSLALCHRATYTSVCVFSKRLLFFLFFRCSTELHHSVDSDSFDRRHSALRHH